MTHTDNLIARLRDTANNIRRKPTALAEVIPMLQEAADAIEALAQPVQEPTVSRCQIADTPCDLKCGMRCKRGKDGVYLSPLVQEPVAYLVYDKSASSQYLAFDEELGDMDGCEVAPLYTAPPQRPWVGITAEERTEITQMKWWDWEDTFDLDGFMQAIENKLRSKNK